MKYEVVHVLDIVHCILNHSFVKAVQRLMQHWSAVPSSDKVAHELRVVRSLSQLPAH